MSQRYDSNELSLKFLSPKKDSKNKTSQCFSNNDTDKIQGSLVFSSNTNKTTSSKDFEHDQVAEYQQKTIGSGLETIPKLNLSKLRHSINEEDNKTTKGITEDKNYFDLDSQANVESSIK